ncbi:hypothetical protein CPB84DRAFT_1676240, partial [Gymnopilus junonius]
PLNYSEPNGREATIAIIRNPSKFKEGSKFYRGPVLFNPGCPGSSGVDMIAGQKGGSFNAILGPQFDIVACDPRGFKVLTPCFVLRNRRRTRTVWTTIGVVSTTKEGITRTWARFKVLGEVAAETDNGYLRLNTENTARDMLSIAQAPGTEKYSIRDFRIFLLVVQ